MRAPRNNPCWPAASRLAVRAVENLHNENGGNKFHTDNAALFIYLNKVLASCFENAFDKYCK